MILQHSFHNEIRSNEYVTMHALAQWAVKRGHSHRLVHAGHMTILTGLRINIVAMLPLLEWHLFRELRELLTVFPERTSEQRMAAPAKTRVTNVVGLCRNVCGG